VCNSKNLEKRMQLSSRLPMRQVLGWPCVLPALQTRPTNFHSHSPWTHTGPLVFIYLFMLHSVLVVWNTTVVLILINVASGVRHIYVFSVAIRVTSFVRHPLVAFAGRVLCACCCCCLLCFRWITGVILDAKSSNISIQNILCGLPFFKNQLLGLGAGLKW
jgi:hypothetical protein